MTFLSQLYPSSQKEGTLRGEMNRQQAKNPHSRTGTSYLPWSGKSVVPQVMSSGGKKAVIDVHV